MKKHHYLFAAMLLTFISVMSAQAQTRTYTVNGVSFKMIAVEGGTFIMGATSEQNNPREDEKSAHKVTLSSFSIGQTEVTQSLWKAVMGSNPSYYEGGGNLPVEQVSWDDCQEFIRKLNEKTKGQRPAGREFRLPTEAEWEFAARGGNKSNHTQYAGSNSLSFVAWYSDNSGGMPFPTHPVAQKKANELVLYDMSGNVEEWCQDWYDENYYSRSPSTNPCNNNKDYSRVQRGGSSWSNVSGCRVTFRNYSSPDYRDVQSGLRLAL